MKTLFNALLPVVTAMVFFTFGIQFKRMYDQRHPSHPPKRTAALDITVSNLEKEGFEYCASMALMRKDSTLWGVSVNGTNAYRFELGEVPGEIHSMKLRPAPTGQEL